MGHIVRIFEHNSGRSSTRSIILLAFLLFSTLVSSRLTAQAVDQVPELERPVPILTGNAGFFTNITGGETELVPSITPVLLLPLGDRWLVESRAEFEGEFERRDGGGPYGGTQKDGDSSPNDLSRMNHPSSLSAKAGLPSMQQTIVPIHSCARATNLFPPPVKVICVPGWAELAPERASSPRPNHGQEHSPAETLKWLGRTYVGTAFHSLPGAGMSFKEQWNEYRKRRNWLPFAVLGFLIVLPLADYLGYRVLQSEAVFASLAIGWMGFFGVSAIRLMYWHCPRCGACFGATWWYRNPLARRCVHCKLPKFSDC